VQTPTAAQQAEPAPAIASKRSRAGRLLRRSLLEIMYVAGDEGALILDDQAR